MEISSKKMAIATLIIDALFLVYTVLFILFVGTSPLFIVMQLITVIALAILGLAILSEKTGILSIVALIVFALASINFPIGTLGILLSAAALTALVLCRKFIKQKSAISVLKKLWFVPAAIVGIFAIIHLIVILSNWNIFVESFSVVVIIFDILVTLAIVLQYLIIGYWAVQKLDIVDSDTKQERINQSKMAYYDDLLKRGVITKEEYDSKIRKEGL